MTIKNKIGLISTFLIFLLTLFITIRLSGHKHSLGILTIGLFCIDFFAVIIGLILYLTKLLKTNMFLVFTGLIIMTFALFFIYHRTYDSYNETRKILWGLNGEKWKLTPANIRFTLCPGEVVLVLFCFLFIFSAWATMKCFLFGHNANL